MPNRLIRDGFLDSSKVDSLSAEAERFFFRLLIACDDAGRMDGRLVMLRSKLLPLRPDTALDRIAEWLDECHRVGLVTPYECDGTPYIQVMRTQRYGKMATSKYPFSDGSHAVEYEIRSTRDGPKEYVKTSLPHTHPIPTPSGGITEKKTYTYTSTNTGTGITHGEFSSEYNFVSGIGKFKTLDYESFVTTFHNAGQPITDEFMSKLAPLIKTADWPTVYKQGEARWLGWQIGEVNKKPKKNRSGSNI